MYECEHDGRKRNPKEKANIFSLITFFFTRDIFRIGLKKDVAEKDIYKVVKACESAKLGNALEEQWNKECKKSKPSLVKALWRTFGKEYLFIGFNQLIYSTVLVLLEPYLVGKIVAFFTSNQTSIKLNEAYLYATGLVLTLTLKELYMHNCYLYLFQMGTKIRVAICSLVYRKSLRLSQVSLTELSSGRIITLVSKDIYTLDGAIFYGNELWIGVLQVIALTYVIYKSVDYSAFVGVGFMLVIIPIQSYISKFSAMLRKKSAKKTDERLRLIQEILTTIRIIKMYTWEKFYINRVDEERRMEIKKLRLILYIKNIVFSIGQFSWRVSFYLLVITYLYFGHEVTADKIFIVLSCYSTLRHYMAVGLPVGMTHIVEATAAVDRIKAVLKQTPLDVKDEEIVEDDKIPMIKMHNVIVSLSLTKTIFDGINLEIKQGLVALTGPLGAGKTSLLKAILHDLKIVSGDIKIFGNISYASQEPWLFPATLRQNVLFGEPYDPIKYQNVIETCSLRNDIQRLPYGDETIIIDKGLNLSRGQQARVNLARALYKEADIYLLDDPLSSVDANVSRNIFNSIKDSMQKKLCVIVTHQQQYLKEINKIYYLKNGKLLIDGNYEDLLKSEYGDELMRNQIDYDDVNEEVIVNNKEENGEVLTEKSKLLEKKNVYHENKKEGKVSLDMYKTYFASGNGCWLLFLIAILFFIAQGSASYFDYFVTRWINVEEDLHNLNLTNSTERAELVQENNKFSLIYSILIGVVVISDLVRALTYFYFASTASIMLHNRIFRNVMKATMEFFDLTLSANILNRFSKDIGIIDELLPSLSFCFLKVFFIAFGSIALIINAHYIFVLYSLIYVVILCIMRQYYLPTSTSLKRLDGSTRAPVVGHINATLEGLTTIRAHKAQKMLIKQFDKHQDLNTSANYMHMTITRAFAFYTDFICKLYLASILYTFLTISLDSTSGNVGLAITEAIGLSGLVQIVIRTSADVENLMTSVERVVEYSIIKTEREDGKELGNWPKDGRIEFRLVNLKYYKNIDLTLNDLTFIVEPKEKIGVIGRTGAGKSSIISTLFRLYDVTGQIIIDNEDIKLLNLNYLRENLSIIPQNPVLFTGTFRTNLDPKNEHSDDTLWEALEAVQIKDLIKNLDGRIEEGGSNYSIGQRQLICLARSLIKKNKILILDEATANVDPHTETLIQKTIRDKFSDCTVLTIAHRLDTVIDSDKILVLDKGCVIEYGKPQCLLKDTNSRFYHMAKQSGLI